MALSRRQGAAIDRSFFNVLAGRSAIERGARKAASGIKKEIQQAKVNKQRGYSLEKKKYGKGLGRL